MKDLSSFDVFMFTAVSRKQYSLSPCSVYSCYLGLDFCDITTGYFILMDILAAVF